MNERDILRLAGDAIAILCEPTGYVEELVDGQGRVTRSAFLDGDTSPVAIALYGSGEIPLAAEIYCRPDALHHLLGLLQDALQELSPQEFLEARPEVLPKPCAFA